MGLSAGSYTFTGSVSGYSCTVSINESTTDVYVMPEGALYWYGNECSDVIGGWNTQGKYSDYTSSASGTVTKNSDHIKITVQSNVWAVCTDNVVNLSGYSSLHCIFENTTGGNISISLSETKLKEFGEIGRIVFEGSSAIKELVFNFNSSSSAYVTVGGYISTIKTYAVWLE